MWLTLKRNSLSSTVFLERYQIEWRASQSKRAVQVMRYSIPFILGYVLVCSVLAIESYSVSSLYDKVEVMIPMRDGVELFAIYTPKQRAEPYPILLTIRRIRLVITAVIHTRLRLWPRRQRWLRTGISLYIKICAAPISRRVILRLRG